MATLTIIPLPGHPLRPTGAGDEDAAIVVDTERAAGAKGARAQTRTVLDLAVSAGVAVATLCGGAMHCRTCRVHVTAEPGATSEAGQRERDLLASDGAGPGERLSCQTRVFGDVVVRVPPPQDMVR